MGEPELAAAERRLDELAAQNDALSEEAGSLREQLEEAQRKYDLILDDMERRKIADRIALVEAITRRYR